MMQYNQRIERREHVDCLVVRESAEITIREVTIRAAPQGTHVVPLQQSRSLAGCSKAHVCGLFGIPPQRARFAAPQSVGCPYHDNLKSG
jgi:hypothetical protein